MHKKILRGLLKDERKAPAQYRRLRNEIKTTEERRAVNGIIRDEQRHARIITRLIKHKRAFKD